MALQYLSRIIMTDHNGTEVYIKTNDGMWVNAYNPDDVFTPDDMWAEVDTSLMIGETVILQA